MSVALYSWIKRSDANKGNRMPHVRRKAIVRRGTLDVIALSLFSFGPGVPPAVGRASTSLWRSGRNPSAVSGDGRHVIHENLSALDFDRRAARRGDGVRSLQGQGPMQCYRHASACSLAGHRGDGQATAAGAEVLPHDEVLASEPGIARPPDCESALTSQVLGAPPKR